MSRPNPSIFFCIVLFASHQWFGAAFFLSRYGSSSTLSYGSSSHSMLHMAAIRPGESVLVIGGTGGVGQLTIAKLDQRGFGVRTTSRNKNAARATLSNDKIDVYEVDLLSKDTTELEKAMDGVSAVVISIGTTAFPTLKWKGGNTPAAIDNEAVTRIANVASQNGDKMKKVVLVTSVGIERTSEMPFVILNLFGVLDAKKKGEDAVMAAAARGGFDYSIIRPGRLVGGPFTNYDVANLLKIEGGAENGVAVAPGDSLLGDCKRDACAEAIVQALTNDSCNNKILSLISTEELALTNEQWTQAFQSL
ncbi:NADPH-binding protein [Nitzschia inconspicua]|uniref:NADPH-binding protein n=1 Tax=Nitzschia inconspicua TaxID=303405 RepID=A0A9K3LK00_9STRA|nr:NADPH-binding protein [Nitzschia inconspicua]KAG7362401.1 NADPH-binding protein [Nitzschia inconspicua]